MSQTWILPEQDRTAMIERIAKFLAVTLPGRKVEVSVKPYVRKRTLEQNSALFGHAYKILRDETGNELEDLHTYFCGAYWGVKEVDVLGESVGKPIRTTTTDEYGKRSVLSTVDFAQFFEFVQNRSAELGYAIPDPVKEVA